MCFLVIGQFLSTFQFLIVPKVNIVKATVVRGLCQGQEFEIKDIKAKQTFSRLPQEKK